MAFTHGRWFGIGSKPRPRATAADLRKRIRSIERRFERIALHGKLESLQKRKRELVAKACKGCLDGSEYVRKRKRDRSLSQLREAEAMSDTKRAMGLRLQLQVLDARLLNLR